MKQMFIWLIVTVVFMAFSGCSLIERASTMLGVTIESGPAIEPAPLPSYDLVENMRRQMGFVKDVVDHVYAEGVAEGNEVVAQARRSAWLLLSYVGPPADAVVVNTLEPEGMLEVEAVEEAVEVIEKVRAKAIDQLTDHQEDEKEWLLGAAEKARAPAKRRFAISSPYIMLFGAGGLVATLSGLALTLRKTLRKVVLYKGSLARVFLAVKDWLGAEPDAVPAGTPQRELLDTLSRKLDQPHKDVIKELREETTPRV